MKKSADVIYLTRKQWDAFKEEEHRERVALSQRVARGELTPEQANREALIRITVFREQDPQGRSRRHRGGIFLCRRIDGVDKTQGTEGGRFFY